MEVIKNNKGGVKICLDENMYTKKSTKASKIQWDAHKGDPSSAKQYFSHH